VFDRCRVEEPPLIDVGEGQRSACWLADGGRRLPVLNAAPVDAPAATIVPAAEEASPGG